MVADSDSLRGNSYLRPGARLATDLMSSAGERGLEGCVSPLVLLGASAMVFRGRFETLESATL